MDGLSLQASRFVLPLKNSQPIPEYGELNC